MRTASLSQPSQSSRRRVFSLAPLAFMGAIALGSVACGGSSEGSFLDLGPLPPPPATATPYVQPTTIPTSQPTSRPTQVPTSQPTSQPTGQPTPRPTQPPASPTKTPPKSPTPTPPSKLPTTQEAIRRLRTSVAPSVKGLPTATVSTYTPDSKSSADDLGGVFHVFTATAGALLSVHTTDTDAILSAAVIGLNFNGDDWSPPDMPDAMCATDKGVSHCALSYEYIVIVAQASSNATVSDVLRAELAFATALLAR